MTRKIATLVLDCEGLSALVLQDRKLMAVFQRFHDMETALVVGANTIVEASHSRTNMPRLHGCCP